MAQALFITTADVKKFTSMNGNVDADKFIEKIKIAQDIHVMNYLGERLYKKLKTDVENSTLAGDYLELVNDYIKPMLIHWAMVEYLPFAAYSIANKGIFKPSSEDSESVSKNEVDYLVEKESETAQNYTRRCIDYICKNSTKFPEYSENEQYEVKPDKTADFGGWYL